MKSRTLHRIYIAFDFLAVKPICLDGNILHYLRDVIRLKVNDKIRIFNENIGEYLAKVIICDKKEIQLELIDDQKLKSPRYLSPLSIAPSLIKNDKFSQLLDMSAIGGN
jgi:RsmE family RNA methyltransferase